MRPCRSGVWKSEHARYEAENRPNGNIRRWTPENRLVARDLEKEWETRLQKLAAAENGNVLRREQQRPRRSADEQQTN